MLELKVTKMKALDFECFDGTNWINRVLFLKVKTLAYGNMGEYKIDNYHFWIVSRLFEKVFPFPESCCSLFHRWSSLRIMFCKCWMLLNMSKWWVASLEVWAFRLLNWNDNTYHALNVAELISDVPTLILLASSFPKKNRWYFYSYAGSELHSHLIPHFLKPDVFWTMLRAELTSI